MVSVIVWRDGDWSKDWGMGRGRGKVDLRVVRREGILIVVYYWCWWCWCFGVLVFGRRVGCWGVCIGRMVWCLDVTMMMVQ